jgi:hypothetical protein
MAINNAQIPIKNYLILSSSERVARFSEDVMVNGSSIGGNVSTHDVFIIYFSSNHFFSQKNYFSLSRATLVMVGTLIFVDIPNTVSVSKSQSSFALATSSSDPDLSKQLISMLGLGIKYGLCFLTDTQPRRILEEIKQ